MEAQSKQLQSVTNIINAGLIECCHNLEKNKSISDLTVNGGHLVLEGNEQVQIHISVTRDKSDFIGDFEMIENTNH